MNMRALGIALGALLSLSSTARAQLVDAVKVDTGFVKGTLEDGLSVFRGIHEYFAWRRTTAASVSATR